MADKECNPSVTLDAMGLVDAINRENKWLTEVNRELLDILQRMHERLTDGRSLPDWAEAWTEEIEAAITKAEGRQS